VSLVSLVEIQKESQVREAILDALDLIGYKFPAIRKVVIKPNLCYYWDYSTGRTTDPRFMLTLINLIRDQASSNIDLSIIESDASAMKCKYAFKMLGYEKLAKQYEVNLVNLTDDETEDAEVTVDNEVFHFRVPNTIRKADLRINVPKLKYMSVDPKIKITCALKNVFGCNPYPRKFEYHGILGKVIVALNKLMKFDLCILDGNIVFGVRTKRMGLVMASRDPVAFDAAAAEIAGVNPKSINYLFLAQREKVGKVSYVSKGDCLEHFKAAYPKKETKDKIFHLCRNLVHAIGLGDRLGI